MKTPRDTSVARLYKQHRKNTDTVICDGCGFTASGYLGTNGKPVWTRLFHVHHIVPLRCGGADSGDNMALLCLNCHAFVHAFYPATGGVWQWERTRSQLRLSFRWYWGVLGGFARKECLRGP